MKQFKSILQGQKMAMQVFRDLSGRKEIWLCRNQIPDYHFSARFLKSIASYTVLLRNNLRKSLEWNRALSDHGKTSVRWKISVNLEKLLISWAWSPNVKR